jgi:hypothetical protein
VTDRLRRFTDWITSRPTPLIDAILLAVLAATLLLLVLRVARVILPV